MPENRVAKRIRRRIPCELRASGRQQRAIVLDCSRTGLFVQTSARLAPGTQVEVWLQFEGQREPMLLRATVARQKAVPSNLTSVAQGGVGLRILDAPRSYYDLLGEAPPDRNDATAPGVTVAVRTAANAPVAGVTEAGRSRSNASSAGVEASSARSASNPSSARVAARGAHPASNAPSAGAAASGAHAAPSSPAARSAAPAAGSRGQPRFRVRVKQCDGPRSRILDIVAESAERACAAALAQVGAGWEALGAERI